MDLFKEAEYIIVHMPDNGKLSEIKCLLRTDCEVTAVRQLFTEAIENCKDGHYQVRKRAVGSSIGSLIKKVEICNGIVVDVV